MMSGNGENKSAFGKIETLDLVKSAEGGVRRRDGVSGRVLF